MIEQAERNVAVHLEVDNTTLRLALLYVLESAGHRRARDRESADAVVVDSGALAHSRMRADAVVVDLVPAACQAAIDAVLAGRVNAIVCSDDPESLVAAILAAEHETVALPRRVVETASRAPRLPDRLTTTLRLVMVGCKNATIAKQLHQSESTVKRDIKGLLAAFQVGNRMALVGAARAAGFGA